MNLNAIDRLFLRWIFPITLLIISLALAVKAFLAFTGEGDL